MVGQALMDVIEAIHERRSIRSYALRPVERDLIESVILDAAQAPPPFSGEVPWTFNVVQGVERIAALGTIAMLPADKQVELLCASAQLAKSN